MDWDPPKALPTLVLEDIFDRAKGWPYPEDTVPLKRVVSKDSNVNIQVTVDGIVITAFEQNRWAENAQRQVSANRLCAMVEFTGVTITDARALLTATGNCSGLPSYGVNAAGALRLHTGFPIAPGFPVDLARRQLMVCMGLLAEQAKENLAALNKTKASGAGTDWDTVKKVAGVAGAFLGAFLTS